MTINKKVTQQLLDTILEKSQLVKLGLVRVNLTDQSFATLLEYVRTSGLLEELDLTWTEIGKQSWVPFFEWIKDNKRLKSVNISYNRIFHPDTQEESLGNLIHFIKRNKNLIHVDMTQCELDEDVVLKIGASLRKAAAIRAIHLCDNPGVNDEVVGQLITRIHAMP